STIIGYVLVKLKQATWYSRRPRSVILLGLGQAGPELGKPLPSRKHNMRRDLCPGHDGGRAVVEDMAHIELMKVLCINVNNRAEESCFHS
ncbi:hypothetical protein BHM03_00034375, partial [Ensete ventricosum]